MTPASCIHAWTPTPADALSAMELAGICHCIKCKRTATREDMAEFGRGLREEVATGHVVHEYDAFR